MKSFDEKSFKKKERTCLKRCSITDMVFDEDRQRVRSDNAPENMAAIRKMALQLLLKHKGKNSLKKTRKKVAWDQGFLLDILVDMT